MCLEAATIALIFSGVGTALSVAGQVNANAAAKQTAAANRARNEFEAQVANNNMIIAERQAKDAIQRGEVEAQQQALRARQIAAQREAAFAGSGLFLGTGTPLDVAESEAGLSALDNLTIRNNAEREALGFRTQASNFQSEEQLALARAKTPAERPGDPLSSVITGASNALPFLGPKNQGGVGLLN